MALPALLFSCTLHAARMEMLDGRELLGEITWSSNGFVVLVGDGRSVDVPFQQVAVAHFGAVGTDLSQFGPLGEGWLSLGLGDVGVAGRAGQAKGTFAVRVATADIGEKTDSFHFVYHRASADAELIIRVLRIEGADRLARVGVMVREALRSEACFAMLSVTASGQLSFQNRRAPNEKADASATNEVAFPCWLRLVKTKKDVKTYHSIDGKTWEVRDSTALRSEDSAYIGIAVSSHGNFSVATATFDHVRARLSGLKGEYFADETFTDLRLTRVDPKVDFVWGLDAPAETLPADHFSVRWTGEVRPKHSEDYTFYLEADDAAKLWLDGLLVPPAAAVRKERDKWTQRFTVPLDGGRRHELRLDFVENDGPALAKLAWSSKSQTREMIPFSALSCVLDSNDDATRTNDSPATSLASAKGILLRDGSFIAGQVKAVQESFVTFLFRGQREMSVPAHKVALVLVRLPKRGPLPEPGRSGVFLNNGDFFEGDFRKVDGRSVKVSSVLFGLRTFHLDDVMAIAFNPMRPGAEAFQVSTSDGSVLRATTIGGTQDEVIVEHPTLGRLTLNAGSVTEFRRAGP